MAKKSFKDMMKEKTENLPSNRLSSENTIKENILILQELKELIPPLRADEIEQLRDNILVHGIADPLTLWETTAAHVTAGLGDESEDKQLFADYKGDELLYVLIDGHNRYAIAKEHQKDFRINIMKFDGLEQVKDYMINYQLGRRNLTNEQISYLRGLRYNHLKKSVSGTSKFGGDVADALSKEYNVSKRTITRDAEFAEGLEKLQPALKKDILSGNKKVPKKAIASLSNERFSELVNENTLDSFVEGVGTDKKAKATSSSTHLALETFVEKTATPIAKAAVIDHIKQLVNSEDLTDQAVLSKLEQAIQLLKSHS